jgi:hypothetical protein
MANMTDQGRSQAIMNTILTFASYTQTWPTGLHIRLMSAMGSGNGNTSGANGTELSTSVGYTAGGVTITFGTVTTAAGASSNAPSWTATGTWTAGVLGIELWDIAGTPLRWLQGLLTTAIAANAVVSGDTVTFAIGAVTATGASW